LNTITQHLQLLIQGGGGAGSGGGGSAGDGLTGGGAVGGASVGGGVPQRRRIDPSCLDNLHFMATRRSLNCARGRIVGTISALDRVAFEDCRQSNSETYDDFYIHLRGLADAGIRDSETSRKLLALSPFPTLQHTINICRSEEAAKANEK
jgi:hypothetical protein